MHEKIQAYYNRYLAFQAAHPQATAAIWAAILLLLFGALLLLFKRMCRGTATAMSSRAFVTKGIRFRDWEIMSPETTEKRMKAVFTILYVLGKYLLLAGYVITVLALFPQTLGIAEYVAVHAGGKLYEVGRTVVQYLPNLLYIAVVVFMTIQAIRLLKAFMLQIEEEKLSFTLFPPEYASPTRQTLALT